jgi:hypothetical protein
MAERWKLTVRDGPAVRRSVFADLGAALDQLQGETVEAANRPSRAAIEMKVRKFEPGDLVVMRTELRGPQRYFAKVVAGIDVRGDGTLAPWVGAGSRSLIDVGANETAWQALRRQLGA